MNHYETLGIPTNASEEDIKKAYKKLAFETHPDRNPNNPEAEKKFKQINEANQVLSDAQKRAQYDADLSGNPFSSFGFGENPFFNNNIFNIEDIFGSFFGKSKKQTNINQAHGETTLSLKEVIHGGAKEINISFNKLCNSCNGTGTKTNSQTITCTNCNGKGNTTVRHGNLTATTICKVCIGKGKINVEECYPCKGNGRIINNQNFNIDLPSGLIQESYKLPNFNIEGNNYTLFLKVNLNLENGYSIDNTGNVMTEIKVPLSNLILGGEHNFAYVDGSSFMLKLPPNIEPGLFLKIKNKGIPTSVGSTQKTDLLIKVQLQLPKSLTEKQKRLLLKLEKTFDEN